jgi:hypothetical protein
VETLDAPEVIVGNLHRWRSLRDLRMGGHCDRRRMPVLTHVLHRGSHKNAVDLVAAIDERYLKFLTPGLRLNHPCNSTPKSRS